MASGAEVGNGYVLIKPTLDDGAINSLESSGTGAGKGFGDAFSVAAGNLIANAVQKLGAAVGDVFKTAFDNYANYEQLVGGVDTLFKESSAIVQANAAKAFETAGISANEYMENVTSFSASLLQSLGGDTKAAAEYADRAMVDMSDNANKMGTDIGRITDAYQGFAKQNYTMLDNLKLGYGGTKEEMQRLIKDAAAMIDVQEKLGITVDESSMSFGNVVNAISVMQDSMGIAGTTAEEGAKTISGSINKLSASWQNFLTGIMDENADLGVLGEQLFSSVGDVITNVAPRILALIQNIILGLPGAIISAIQMLPSMLAPAIVSVFGEQVGGQINETLQNAFSGLAGGLQTVFSAIAETLMSLWTVAQPILEVIVSAIQTAMPLIQDAISTVVGFVTENVLPLVNEIAEMVKPVVEEIAGTIQEYMPEIKNMIQSTMAAIKQIIQTVWPVVSTIIKGAVEVISNIIKTAWPVIRTIIETVSNAIRAITENVWPIISGIVDTAAGAIKGAIEGIEGVVRTVQNIFDAIRHAIEDPIGTARRFIEDAINVIRNLFNFNIEWPHIPLPHFHVWGSPNPLDWLNGDAPGFSIDWYAKGGFVDGATLIGAGEAGPEMILPQQGALMNDFADRIAQRVGGGVDIHDCTFNVRQDSDIRRVAQELNMLINRQTAGGIA